MLVTIWVWESINEHMVLSPDTHSPLIENCYNRTESIFRGVCLSISYPGESEMVWSFFLFNLVYLFKWVYVEELKKKRTNKDDHLILFRKDGIINRNRFSTGPTAQKKGALCDLLLSEYGDEKKNIPRNVCKD